MSSTTLNESRNCHEYPIDARWGEMDALGHINNAEYLRYFETARVTWFASMGYDIMADPQGPVILKLNTTYHLPVVYPCQLKVVSRVTKVGNSSFVVNQQIVGLDDETLYTEAETICVWMDRASNKPTAAPDFVRQLLK